MSQTPDALEGEEVRLTREMPPADDTPADVADVEQVTYSEEVE